MSRHFVSIWFFIGILLTIYGVLILGAGIYDLMYPPAETVKMSHLHAGVWWGGLLILLGVIYTVKFAPRDTGS